MDTGQYDKVSQRMKAVRRDDLRLVDLSDFFIVYINPKIPSWGSGRNLLGESFEETNFSIR